MTISGRMIQRKNQHQLHFFTQIIETLGTPPSSAIGPKPVDTGELEARRNEAARLTRLIEAAPAFSFVRLGDMDLGLLLAAQEGVPEGQPVFSSPSAANGTQAAGCPGIGARHAARFIAAFQNADYVDFHERLWPIGPLLPRLQLDRPPRLHRNPNRETSYLLLTWMEREFQGYCGRHRVGFAGAEAPVLEYLHRQPAFLEAARDIWPTGGVPPVFHRLRNDGSGLDENLDAIKEDLKSFIREAGIDTLFLSLGGAAKILCYELARELNVRCLDFGAMLRSLCYLGSDGNRAGRSTHSPFYHRLPFDLVMDAVEAAYPALTPEVLLAKAHAQTILELQRRERGWTSASTELDFSSSHRSNFLESHRSCARHYGALITSNPEIRLERKRYLHFCGKHGLTGEGRVFYGLFRVKLRLKEFLVRVLDF